MNYLLFRVLGLPLPLSTALAVEAAIVTNFFGNNLWTFRAAELRERRIPALERLPLLGGLIRFALQPTMRRLAKYNAVSLIGLAVTTGVTSYVAVAYEAPLRALAGTEYFLIANLVGIGVAMAWNFFANVVWTWH